jgi:hypothetical protein
MRSKGLSYYVNIQKVRLLKRTKFRTLEEFIRLRIGQTQRILTSKWSILPIALILALFFIFPIDGYFFAYFPLVSSWSSDYYLTLWQVYGAIVGLSFVVLFFFYEAFISRIASSYKNLEFRFRQEFYRKTLLQPLLFYNLLSLLYVGIAINVASRVFQSITLLAVSILSICLLFAKAVSFFDGDELEKTRLQILRSEIIGSIDTEVNRRISANLLRQISEKNEYLKYYPLALGESNYKTIQLCVSERERIVDISIDKIITKIQTTKTSFYLQKGIGEIVSPKYSIVGSIPKGTEEKTIEMLKKSFKLKKEPSRRDLHLIFDDIEEQLRLSVDRRSSKDLTRFLEIYYYSIEELLRTFRLYGINYSAQQAKQGDFLNEWEPIIRIQYDFYHLIEISIETGNREIIRSTVDFVGDVLNLSIENGDFLIFYRFKGFWLNIYYFALGIHDKAFRDFVIELLLRKVKDFPHNLLLHLEYSEVTKEEVDRYHEYVITALLLNEQLLKETIEKKALDAFIQIDKNLCAVSEEYEPEGHSPYVAGIEANLMDTSLSPEEKKQLSESLEIANGKIQLKENIDQLILEIWLGIGGWITELYTKDKLSKDETNQFLKHVLEHFKDMKSLASVYSETTDLSQQFKHAWEWWELEDKNGAVMGLRQEEWITRFYCIAGILLTPNEIKADQSIEPTPESPSTLNVVKAQCQKISSNLEKLAPIIGNISSSDFAVKSENFIKLHERAVEKQKAIESKWLREQPLDEEKIAEFKTQVNNEWKAKSEVRAIIEKFGKFVDSTTAPENTPPVGLQNLAPKDAFVKQANKEYMFFQDYGMSLARYENENISSKILTSCTNAELILSNEVNQKVLNSIKQLREKGYSPNAIFVGSNRIIRNFAQTKEFNREGKTPDDSLKILDGFFNDIPVLSVFGLDKEVICIMDLKRIGAFNQYRVKKDEKDILHFDLIFVDEKTARSYVAHDPKFLENEKGEKIPEAEVINNLQERVFLKILERFEFTVEDGQACVTLRIQPEPTTPT